MDVAELHALVEEIVDRKKVHGAMLMTTKGSLLVMAGFDGMEAQVTGALAANVWSYFSHVNVKYPDAGEMSTMVFEGSEGILAVSSVIGASACFLALYSTNRLDPGFLVVRISELRAHFSAIPGLVTLVPEINGPNPDNNKDSRS